MAMWSDEIETEVANTGENVKLKIKNAEEEDIMPGFVICSPDNLCKTGSVFDAQVSAVLVVRIVSSCTFSAVHGIAYAVAKSH